jgi:anti-anti-sigma factor
VSVLGRPDSFHPPSVPVPSGPPVAPEAQSTRPELAIATRSVGFRTVLTVAGSVNPYTVDALDRALARLVVSSARDVWIDLTGVTFLDAAGIAALLDTADELAHRHRGLALIAPPGPARTSLRLRGADRRLTLFATRADAHRAS